MNAFELLSESMRRTVWKLGWATLTPVQEAAIPVILHGHGDVVIASETASGKTEAAFLPILSLIESTYAQGIKVLYVSPLKALINDQFQRIQVLCDSIGVPVHRWHGDVSQAAKRKTVAAPAGVLQITPESIESLFVNRTGDLRRMFRSLEFVVIDEVHAFLGTERGTHLRSLLARLENTYSELPIRYIALSATIGSYEYIRKWLRPRDPERVQVLTPKGTPRTTYYCVMYFPSGPDNQRPLELYEDMRELTRHQSALIFCNSRADVEETAYHLNRLAAREGEDRVYLVHHASIDASERAYVEATMKSAKRPLSVVTTSTLEMGIDIGRVDLVIQVDATFTVSSLKQRLGRSGRRPGSPRVLQLYATSDEDLLQAIAVTELFLQGWVEPPRPYAVPFDVLFHQLISLCAEHNGLTLDRLLEAVHECEVFREIREDEIRRLIQYMVEEDYLERLPGRGEFIVGIEGERLLRSQDFYAVFQTQDMYEVVYGTRVIGSLARDIQYERGTRVILAGRVWEIKEVDEYRNRLYVEPAARGEKPIFGGDPVPVHHKVRTMMAEVLYGTKQYTYLYGRAAEHLEAMRMEGRLLGMTPERRLLVRESTGVTFRAFAGDQVARTLALMITRATGKPVVVQRMGWLAWAAGAAEAKRTLQSLASDKPPSTAELMRLVPDELLMTTKFGRFLPTWAKRRMHESAWLDVEGAMEFLATVDLVVLEH